MQKKLPDITAEEREAIQARIRQLSEFNVTHIREILLHFQVLKSARASRLMMDAPGLYFTGLKVYVISKAGAANGHTPLYKAVRPLIPDGYGSVYGFVLYPESYVRSCLDKLLRKTTCIISKDMRLSMENVFNKKYHTQALTGSQVEQEIVSLFQEGLSRRSR